MCIRDSYTTVQPGYGDQYNNEAIAGCVMGGTSMVGGLASIGGTVIGVFICLLYTSNSYCSLVTFREAFFVNKVHRKPENCGAKSCECMISVHREARYCERSEQ